jgi:hypothetical protein
MPGRFEPLHTTLPLARGLMGIFGAVVQRAMLTVFHTWENLPLGCAIAFQLIREDHPGDVLQALEQLAKEFLRRLLVPPALHQDVEHVALLIHGPPEIVTLSGDGQKRLIQMPFVARTGAPTPELIGLGLAKLATPFPDGLIRHDDATGKQQLFDIPVAEAEPIVEPDAMANDFGRKAVVLVSLGGDGRGQVWLPLCLTKWLSLEDASLGEIMPYGAMAG